MGRPERTRFEEASGWVLVGGTIVAWSFLLFGYNDAYPWLALVEVVTSVIGLGIIVTALWHQDEPVPSAVGYLGLVVALGAFLVWCWIQIRVAPAYGTDEAAFDQYAAQLFVHGVNPYTHSMQPAFDLFHVSPDGHTFRIDGTSVTSLSYPAFSFLVYVPFLLLGWSSQLAINVNVLAWALAVMVAYVLLPRAIRPLAIVIGSLAIYTGFAVGGVTDAIYMPLLIGAVYQWDRYADASRPMRWVTPTLMALAMSVKQTVWFVVPFILVGLFLESRGPESTGRQRLVVPLSYLARLLMVFVVINLYSIVQGPTAWIRGVFTPFFDHLVPAGEGWIAISNFLGQGGGNLLDYTVFVSAVGLASVVLYVITYPRSKPLAVFLPSLVLFFASRSYSNYLVMLILPSMVAFCSVHSGAARPSVKRMILSHPRGRVALIAVVTLVPTVAIVTTLTPQPVALGISSVTTTGQLATVVAVNVNVTNRTGHTLTPVFASESGGAITAPWVILSGPNHLGAHAHATYTLQAPNFFAQPSLTGGFQMVALTTTPAALSVSRPFLPTTLHATLIPEAVERPVGIGHLVTLRAQVLNASNQPVNVADIPVFLGQVSYTQPGLVYTQAVINNSSPGATPVEASTNAQGVATFSVTNFTSSVNPVYFEANLVNQLSNYPYGYSNIVTIRFK